MWAEDANDPRLSAIRQQNDRLFATVCELEMPTDAPLVFVCECADSFCIEYVKVTIADYSRSRRDRSFILCPGHQAPQAQTQTQAA